MTNNSPATDFPFTGYRYHRKPVDLGKLWASFTHKTAEQIEWERKVYVTGQHQPISSTWVDREAEKQMEETI